jgi:hypothetical protein
LINIFGTHHLHILHLSVDLFLAMTSALFLVSKFCFTFIAFTLFFALLSVLFMPDSASWLAFTTISWAVDLLAFSIQIHSPYFFHRLILNRTLNFPIATFLLNHHSILCRFDH